MREVRVALADPRVRMALLVVGERLWGTLVAADLPDELGDDEAAAWHAQTEGRTVAAAATARTAYHAALLGGSGRVAVVHPDGRLVGLVCLNRFGRRLLTG